MKKPFAILALVGLLSQEQVQGVQLSADIRFDSIWEDAMGGADTSSYTKDTPKAYMEKEKPKVDYKAIERKKKAAQAMAQKK